MDELSEMTDSAFATLTDQVMLERTQRTTRKQILGQIADLVTAYTNNGGKIDELIAEMQAIPQ